MKRRKKRRLIFFLLITLVLLGGLSLTETYQTLLGSIVRADGANAGEGEAIEWEESTQVGPTQPQEEPVEIEEEGPKEIKVEIVESIGKQDPTSGKKVFLTFDDGPTRLTPKVLDILKKHEIEASFFTIGRLLEGYPEIARRAYREGHMILPHSYSHDFAIYTSFDRFYEDFYLAEEVYEQVMGFKSPPIFRFPGGSYNQSSFKYGGEQFMPMLTEDIKTKGYTYIDWNVVSGDTTEDYNNSQKMLENVLTGAKNKDYIVVLFHDTERNEKILDMLPEMIETLKERGYHFRTFRDITEEEMNRLVELKLANRVVIR